MGRIKAVFRRLRARYGWLDHIIRAYGQYQGVLGDHQAAAITFFSFLSIFPILVLAVSVLGFVLAGNDDLRNDVINAIVDNVPGGIVDRSTLDKVIDQRAATGVVGLLTLALTGTSWIDNVRSAMEVVWGRQASKIAFLKKKGGDLLILVVVGIALAVSFVITSAGTSLTGLVLSPLGLDDATWATALALIVGLLLGVAWDTGAFTVILLVLPKVDATRAAAWRGSLLAAVGFEALKVAASYYLKSLNTNPAVVGFGSVVGVLIFINLVARYLLFCAAWTSTLHRETPLPPAVAVAEATSPAEPAAAEPLSPAAVGAGLFGAGAAAGLAAAGAVGVRRRRSRSRRAVR